MNTRTNTCNRSDCTCTDQKCPCFWSESYRDYLMDMEADPYPECRHHHRGIVDLMADHVLDMSVIEAKARKIQQEAEALI